MYFLYLGLNILPHLPGQRSLLIPVRFNWFELSLPVICHWGGPKVSKMVDNIEEEESTLSRVIEGPHWTNNSVSRFSMRYRKPLVCYLIPIIPFNIVLKLTGYLCLTLQTFNYSFVSLYLQKI